MILKLSFKKLLRPIVTMLIVVGSILTIGFIYAGGYDARLLPGFIIVACIPFLPTTYLCLEYFFASRNRVFEINYQSITITHNDGIVEQYAIDDLSIVKLYKSAGMEKGSFPIQSAEMYYHATIFTKDGNKLILTSILDPNIDEALSMLKGVPINVTRTVYSTLYF